MVSGVAHVQVVESPGVFVFSIIFAVVSAKRDTSAQVAVVQSQVVLELRGAHVVGPESKVLVVPFTKLGGIQV